MSIQDSKSDSNVSPKDAYTTIGTPGALSGYSGFLRNTNLPDSDSLRRSLNSLQAFTLHKPTRKHFQRRKIRVNFLDYVWGLDLIDMKSMKTKNSHFAWILVVQVIHITTLVVFILIFICFLLQDIFSRYLFLKPLKSKHGENVVAALKEIFVASKRKPSRYFWSDQGLFSPI